MPRVWLRISRSHLSMIALAALALSGCMSTGGSRNSGSGERCAVRNAVANPHVKVGTPYKIAGITYRPAHQPGYVEEGVASWYGPNFHCGPTANGEIFDQNRLTAAHKTLPLPSLVRVTNLENGKSEVLRLNDRGPFSGDRLIDLSRAAADALGTRQQGLARVRVEYLGPARLEDAVTGIGQPENYAALRPSAVQGDVAPSAVSSNLAARPSTPRLAQRASFTSAPTPPPPSQHPRRAPSPALPSGHYVQLGVFRGVDGVQAARALLPEVIPFQVTTENDPMPVYVVRLGPYPHDFSAREAARVARDAGFSDVYIVEVPARS